MWSMESQQDRPRPWTVCSIDHRIVIDEVPNGVGLWLRPMVPPAAHRLDGGREHYATNATFGKIAAGRDGAPRRGPDTARQACRFFFQGPRALDPRWLAIRGPHRRSRISSARFRAARQPRDGFRTTDRHDIRQERLRFHPSRFYQRSSRCRTIAGLFGFFWLQLRLEVCCSAPRLRRRGGFGSLESGGGGAPFLSAPGAARP
jgi:hypothetical protein